MQEEIMNNEHLTEGYSLELTEQQQLIKQAARDFAEREMRPTVMQYDESQEFPMEIFKKCAELGFLGIIFPEEYEGAGLGYVEYALIVEELGRVDPSTSLGVAAHNGLCTNHIYRFASEELKRKYVPDLASGRKIGMWGLTEPGSGSDAGGMKTTAELEGDYWIINGSKNFITHATVGDTAVVLAVTDKEKGTGGISAFVLEKGMEGFAPGRKENKLGMRSSDTASLVFNNVRVPKNHLIGEVNDGFKQALKILDGGRISIAALAIGTAQGAYETALNYSKERKQFGKTLAEFQATQFKLADMAMQIEAARMMTQKAAVLRDQGRNVNLLSAEAKLFASEVAVRVSNEAVQILGGYGYTKDYPAEKFYRDCKLLTIGEGTSEVQRIVISRALLKE
jgi:alkylation response protein AidB-like acyl-CoA dehydrogenase